MKFEAFDDILAAWSKDRAVPLKTSYRDEQVRSFEIVDQIGRRYQIWVDPPNEISAIGVHVWDLKRRRLDYFASRTTLYSILDAARCQIDEWSLE